MAALPNLLTVAEFRELPDDGEYAYELHHGEVVAVTRPNWQHSLLQKRLAQLLSQKMEGFGEVVLECGYRPLREFELRAADVAVVSRGRADRIEFTDNLHGAPDLVVEVRSPSNTTRQLHELVSLCLSNGAIECWIVDPRHASVTVTNRDGTTMVYMTGQEIPLGAFGSDRLEVAAIFEGLIAP
jgi:Uma2 family endonuclease